MKVGMRSLLNELTFILLLQVVSLLTSTTLYVLHIQEIYRQQSLSLSL